MRRTYISRAESVWLMKAVMDVTSHKLIRMAPLRIVFPTCICNFRIANQGLLTSD